MRKLNTKLIKSAARYPQIDGLIKCVDETVQIIMHCYSPGFCYFFSFDWVSHIPMVDFDYYFNEWYFDIFEVSNEYLPTN